MNFLIKRVVLFQNLRHLGHFLLRIFYHISRMSRENSATQAPKD